MRILLVLIAVVLLGCKEEKKASITEPIREIGLQDSIEHPGKKLMETHCYVCHGPLATKDERIAPPMAAIKAMYMDSTTTEKEFASNIWTFVNAPSKEKAKLKGAVKRFGVMPYQSYTEENIKSIAEYLFKYQIEEPVWFKKHWEENHGNTSYKQKGIKGSIISNALKTKEEIGLEYALSTKKVLGKNLMSKIQKEGTLAALEFCNIRALSLTDSIATAHNAIIKRVTDKPRNTVNQANKEELGYITKYKEVVANGLEVKPFVNEEDKIIQFYYPIITNNMCLQCHGSPKNNIKPEVLTALFQLYPEDKAKGYKVNEVRGMWSIQYKQ